MMKKGFKVFKILVILLAITDALFIWFDQSRSFFKTPTGEYITMWKRAGGNCYLILGKYYGITRPKDNYIKTKNWNEDVVFLWKKNNNTHNLLYYSNVEDSIYNIDKTQWRINNYLENEQKNDSLYTEECGYYKCYKKGIILLSIDVFEGYAINREGKIQK